MNLAAILGFCLLRVGLSASSALGLLAHAAQTVPSPTSAQDPNSASPSSTSSAQPQAAPTQNSGSSKTPVAQSPTKTNSAPAKSRARAKKVISPDCSDAPAGLNPAPVSQNTAKPEGRAQDGATANSGLANGSSANSSAPARSSNLKPCPPPKKIVRNGGADEPKIELLGGSPAEQASNQRSTQEITAATEENLKKVSARQLNSSDKETVAQINQFIEESKQAAAAGDPERAHNLATKARLLSEQLLGP
jgi:hypothetical protein